MNVVPSRFPPPLSLPSSPLSLLKQGKVPSLKKKQVLNPFRFGLSSAALLMLPLLTRFRKHMLTLSRALNTHTLACTMGQISLNTHSGEGGIKLRLDA